MASVTRVVNTDYYLVHVPKSENKKNLIFCLDISGSMFSVQENTLSKQIPIKMALHALELFQRFIETSEKVFNEINLICFATKAYKFDFNIPPLSILSGLSGGTNFTALIEMVYKFIHDSQQPTIIILLTDGHDTSGLNEHGDLMQKFKLLCQQTSSVLYPIALGKETNEQYLLNLCCDDNPKYVSIDNANELIDILTLWWSRFLSQDDYANITIKQNSTFNKYCVKLCNNEGIINSNILENNSRISINGQQPTVSESNDRNDIIKVEQIQQIANTNQQIREIVTNSTTDQDKISYQESSDIIEFKDIGRQDLLDVIDIVDNKTNMDTLVTQHTQPKLKTLYGVLKKLGMDIRAKEMQETVDKHGLNFDLNRKAIPLDLDKERRTSANYKELNNLRKIINVSDKMKNLNISQGATRNSQYDTQSIKTSIKDKLAMFGNVANKKN